MTDETGTTTYTYDDFGNLTTETKGDIVKTNSYDVMGNRTGFTVTKDGVTTTYTYNGDGLRMSKTTNGVTTSFILDGADVVAEIKGNEVTVYSRGLGLISQTKGDTTKTYFSDDHGNVTGMYSSATETKCKIMIHMLGLYQKMDCEWKMDLILGYPIEEGGKNENY